MTMFLTYKEIVFTKAGYYLEVKEQPSVRLHVPCAPNEVKEHHPGSSRLL